MPHYLIKAQYEPDAYKAILDSGGTDRVEAVTKALEDIGGKVVSFFFAFGDDDAYVTVELPDNVSAAALAMQVAASGVVGVTTVVLLTPEEVDAASDIPNTYVPPGKPKKKAPKNN